MRTQGRLPSIDKLLGRKPKVTFQTPDQIMAAFASLRGG